MNNTVAFILANLAKHQQSEMLISKIINGFTAAIPYAITDPSYLLLLFLASASAF